MSKKAPVVVETPEIEAPVVVETTEAMVVVVDTLEANTIKQVSKEEAKNPRYKHI